MLKIKLGLLGLLAICAFSAAAASTASAAEWWVNGASLKGEQALAEKTTVDEPFVISTTAASIECSEIKVTGGVIAEGNNNHAEALVFGKCTISGSAGCKVAATQTSKPVVFPLEEVSKAIKLDFKPKTGKIISEIEVSGTGCALEGTQPFVSGTKGMICNYPGVETEKTEHELVFTTPSSPELKWANLKALFKGVDLVKLTSGSKWSAKP